MVSTLERVTSRVIEIEQENNKNNNDKGILDNMVDYIGIFIITLTNLFRGLF